jgi:hypothetical protein
VALLTEAGLCNVALLRVGERQTIDNLDEMTESAMACKALYGLARDELLEATWWRWATRRTVLAALATETRSGWGSVYALPADCVTARYIYAGQRNPSADSRIPFLIEASDSGRVLLTDEVEAELVYTARIETVALFPARFADALAWRLAVDLMLAIPVKPQLATIVERKAQASLATAIAADRNEAQEDAEPDSEFIRVRG